MSIVLTTLVTFLIVTGIIVSVFYAATAESVLSQRVKRFVSTSPIAASSRLRAAADEAGIVRRLLAGIGKYGIGGGDVAQRLSVAGLRGSNGALMFLGTRTLLSVGPALVVLVTQVSLGRPLGRALALAGLVWAWGHLGANYWLRRRARLRTQQIATALPDALDLMVVCLEAGLGLNATISRVGEERAKMHDPLGDEFAQVALELRSGRTRDDALRGLGDRNGVDDLKALVALVIQSDRLGASLAKTLRSHADLLRTKRRQRAEEQARKLPIKMLFPLALFILPALFVVTTGPALLALKDLASLLKKG